MGMNELMSCTVTQSLEMAPIHIAVSVFPHPSFECPDIFGFDLNSEALIGDKSGMADCSSNPDSQSSQVDPSFATLLLSTYEKSRAREMNEWVDFLHTAEYQHFLSTYGHSGVRQFAEELSEEERNLQMALWLAVVGGNRRSFLDNAEMSLRSIESHISSKLVFRYVMMSRALTELEMKTKALKEENQRLASQIANFTSKR
jgi:hypothetical protein